MPRSRDHVPARRRHVGRDLGGSPAAADGSGNATMSITLPGRRTAGLDFRGRRRRSCPVRAAPRSSSTRPSDRSAGGLDAAWHDVVVGLSAAEQHRRSGSTRSRTTSRGRGRTITGRAGTSPSAPTRRIQTNRSHTITFYATDDAGKHRRGRTATVDQHDQSRRPRWRRPRPPGQRRTAGSSIFRPVHPPGSDAQQALHPGRSATPTSPALQSSSARATTRSPLVGRRRRRRPDRPDATHVQLDNVDPLPDRGHPGEP